MNMNAEEGMHIIHVLNSELLLFTKCANLEFELLKNLKDQS